MSTYIAQIVSTSGTQQIQLAAANIQDAQSQLESRAQTLEGTPLRYTIQEQSPVQSPEFMPALLTASGALFGCLLVLAIGVEQLRRYFKT